MKVSAVKSIDSILYIFSNDGDSLSGLEDFMISLSKIPLAMIHTAKGTDSIVEILNKDIDGRLEILNFILLNMGITPGELVAKEIELVKLLRDMSTSTVFTDKHRETTTPEQSYILNDNRKRYGDASSDMSTYTLTTVCIVLKLCVDDIVKLIVDAKTKTK